MWASPLTHSKKGTEGDRIGCNNRGFIVQKITTQINVASAGLYGSDSAAKNVLPGSGLLQDRPEPGYHMLLSSDWLTTPRRHSWLLLNVLF